MEVTGLVGEETDAGESPDAISPTQIPELKRAPSDQSICPQSRRAAHLFTAAEGARSRSRAAMETTSIVTLPAHLELSSRAALQRWAEAGLVALEKSRVVLERDPDHSALSVHPLLPLYITCAISLCLYMPICAAHQSFMPPVAAFFVFLNTPILVACLIDSALGCPCDGVRGAQLRLEWRRYFAWKRLLLRAQHGEALRTVLQHLTATIPCKSIFDDAIVAAVCDYDKTAVAFRVARVW